MVDDGTVSDGEKFLKIADFTNKVGIESGGGFDFASLEFAGIFDNEVNLIAGFVAQEVEILPLVLVFEVFSNFGNDEVFENLAIERMVGKLGGSANVEESAEETGIIKVDFGSFN